MKIFYCFFFNVFLLVGGLSPAWSQTYSVSGKITNNASGLPVTEAEVRLSTESKTVKSDAQGFYQISDLGQGNYTVIAFKEGLAISSTPVEIRTRNVTLNFTLTPLVQNLDEVLIEKQRRATGGLHLNGVEGTAIYEAKKSEVVVLNNITANLATNNSRQIFGKVAGLNIWESDGGGLQLGIGGRGLSPNRTSNFNTRQNGYDISADALGYPESYYTPPMEALDRIEIVRGAASLQYGTQFGGMVNFVLKQGPKNKPVEFTSRQTAGSFGLFNSFNSVGGTKGKLNYYTYYQYKRSKGWRPNSNLEAHTAYTALKYQVSDKVDIGFNYTFMNYLAQQPGGLTDAAFNLDPQQSVRQRNWFKVNWNLLALTLDYALSDRTKINTRNFGLLAERDALGYLEKINRPDPLQERLLLKDKFKNFGNETRLLHRYNLLGSISTFLVGARYYHGFTDQKQGLGSVEANADFNYYPDATNPGISDYDYPSQNLSVFTENIFNLSPKFSLTPGIRYEQIYTKASGRYDVVVKDQAGNILQQERVQEKRTNSRGLVLFGLGVSYKQKEQVEVYGNFSQNYRAINFNDMRVVNANIRIDPNLQDEKGYSADLGSRGSLGGIVDYDVSLFYLNYANRIGLRPAKDTILFTNYLLRTNIGKSRNQGIETFLETDIFKLLYGPDKPTSLSVFSNITLVDADYKIEEEVFRKKKVEFAPSVIAKTGLSFKRHNLKVSYQYSYTSSQFTDATNSLIEPTAIFGKIPAYSVMDLSASYTYKWLTLESGINNLADNRYFTRRATAYPGPGIIPADAQNFYLTLQVKL